MPTALVDSSVLIAVANPSDGHHSSAVAALSTESGLSVPVTILAETMAFIRARLGEEKQRIFWEAFAKTGIGVVAVDAELLASAFEIDGRCRDVGFGFADSVLLATCERLRCARVMSFDRRLATYRPSFASHLEVLP